MQKREDTRTELEKRKERMIESRKILVEMQQRLRQTMMPNLQETPANSKSLPQESTPCIDRSLFLHFEDVSYSVRAGILTRERKQLLKGVNGEFRPCEVSAIMGLSGAGKSTLLDVLAGFATSAATGNVMVNNEVRDLSEFRRVSAYIMQNDNLQPLLTVQESMDMGAELKLTTSNREKEERVNEILVAMGLDGCRHTRTGKLSSGERKRLAIALEIINRPPIMFLDEPTSGLDSVTSKQCMVLLKKLAREGQTIICTIHQPSATLLNIIDHLYVVADGSCVYTGSTQNLVPYLNSLGLECPTHYNPADFLMEICNGDYGKHVPKLIEAIENGKSDAWRSTTITLNLSRQEEVLTPSMTASLKAQQCQAPMKLYSFEMEYKHTPYYATSFWKQLYILLKRNAIRLSRDKVLTFTRLSMHFVIALLVGTIFFQIGQDAAYVLDNFNLLFFNIMFLMFSAYSATVTSFPSELPIIVREHFNRWYKLHSVYLANKLADFPVQLTAICTYIVIVYCMSDQLLELQRFCLYTLMCVAVSFVAQMIGLLVGTGMNLQNGTIFGPLCILPFLMFSGFFVHLSDAHPALHWLFHVSFLKYAFEGVMVAIYGYGRPKLYCSDVYCHFAVPDKLLVAVDMKHADYWYSIIVLAIIYVVLDLGAYTLLRLKVKRFI